MEKCIKKKDGVIGCGSGKITVQIFAVTVFIVTFTPY